MMEEITQFIQYLESEKEACLMKSNVLIKDNCRNEADMMKIRANIFDIITTVSRTAEKRFPQNSISFMKEKIESIPKGWKESLSVAEKHGDHAKVMIEQLKLQAIAEINEKFSNILEKNK